MAWHCDGRLAISRVFSVLGVAAVLAMTVGCQKPSGSAATESKDADSSKTGDASTDLADAPASRSAAGKVDNPDVDPAKLLEEMVGVYRQAKSYQDAGKLQIGIESEGGEKQASPTIPFSVAFERPNKIRVHSLEASIVCDGDKLRASADSLERQVLVLTSPEKLTAENLISDPLLAQAMHGQIGVAMPQLALLLDNDPVQQIAGDGAPTRLADEELDGEKCYRVAIKGRSGSSVFWISPKSRLLVKFEFPADAFKEKYSLAAASITADFKGARLDSSISAEAFKFAVPEGAKLLTRFLPPPPEAPSPMLAQKPGDFTFVDPKGGTVTRESLQGKIVVLDMWATWCGWCFEGFPNLQKVYDEFKDNDKVAILAVNTDDLQVSDEKVQQSFEKAQLTIPIVRDQRRAADEMFKVQGLPTMVILGADGSVEDYHIGYDAQLAETLPKKLNALLAGQSLAKEALEKFQRAQQEYEQQENAALVADSNAKPE